MSTFKLSSSITSPLSVGPYLLQPNVQYSDKSVPLDNPDVAHSFAWGQIVFNDGTNITSHLQSPVIVAALKKGNASRGKLGTVTNAYGA